MLHFRLFREGEKVALHFDRFGDGNTQRTVFDLYKIYSKDSASVLHNGRERFVRRFSLSWDQPRSVDGLLSRQKHVLRCTECGGLFNARRSDAKTCSDACRVARSRGGRRRDPVLGRP